MKITVIKELRAQPQVIIVEEGIRLKEVADSFQSQVPYRILAARINNKLEDLNIEIKEDCQVEFLDVRSQSANLIYQHSLIMIYLKAISDVLGKTDVEIANSLNKGLYTEVRFFREEIDENGKNIRKESRISDDEILLVEKRMRELVAADLPFTRQRYSREKAAELLVEDGDVEKMRILNSSNVDTMVFYCLDGYWNFFYGKMVPSTGYVEYFELRPYNDGKAVLLRFPHHSKPDQVPFYEDDFLLSEAFGEAKKWGRLMKCAFVSDLNDKIHDGSYKELILISEALHAKKLGEVVERIKEEGKRIILIAGPSSSGKTTFAKRLGIQLRVEGLEPLYLGTDDYFVERKDTPLDENGEPDYESLRAIDVELFNQNLNDLLLGKEVDIPTFDFIKGEKHFGHNLTSIKPNQLVIIEGIHALNDAMTPEIDHDDKFKIYISPLTNLNIDAHNRISTTDSRMLRRLVRDNLYRGHNAQRTIQDWPKVRAGEDVNIFPYNSKADVFFNSVHIFELAVLKTHAVPLLKAIKREEPEYAEAHRFLAFLRFFQCIEDEHIIPNNSVLREFIGGSIFMDEV